MGPSPRPEADDPTTTHELHHGAVVVNAWAPWCSSCRAIGPIVDDVAARTGVPVIGLQVDTDPALVERFGVRSVPTLLALRDGAEVERLVGLQPPDVVQSLFGVAAGTVEQVRRRAPTSLVAARCVAGVVIASAAALVGSVVLGMIGALLTAWALIGLVRR